ncbi:MAG: hypothetical protein FD174_662 [Geobacteraceae bacterium]|nr:MAG: hypothetical protein FD174_662 [Geobacteraceae bacterium]
MNGNGEKELDELLRELNLLRGLVRDVGEGYILRREGEIETLISYLKSLSSGSLKTLAPSLLQEVRSIKLKPAKGRIKDLKGLDDLIEDLTDDVINAQNIRKNP